VATRQVDILSGLEGLRGLRDEWLALQSASESPFYVHYQWYEALVGSLLEVPTDLLILRLRSDGACRGIVPLLPSSPRWGMVVLRALGLPYRDHVDLADVLLADGECLAPWRSLIFEALRKRGVSSSALHFASIPGDAAALRGGTSADVATFYHAPRYSCVIDCSRPYELVSAAYSTRLRKIIRRGLGRLDNLGELRLQRICGGSEAGAAFEAFLRIEASGWKGAGGTATAIRFCERARRFYSSMFLSSGWDGMAEVSLLVADGQVLAGQLSMVSGMCRHMIKIAFDQRLERFSPGTVMLDMQIRRMCADDGPKLLSLVTGAPWMLEWGPQKLPVGDLWMFRDRISGALIAWFARRYSAWRRRAGLGTASASLTA
jgi:CelD/BcsL family acetyltransferase involved in cellulose biosynthesis